MFQVIHEYDESTNQVLEQLKGTNSVIIKDGSGSMGFNFDTPMVVETVKNGLFGSKTSTSNLSREQAANELALAYVQQVMISDPAPDLCIFDDTFWYEQDCVLGSSSFSRFLSQRSSGEDYIIPALDHAFKVHNARKANPLEKSKTIAYIFLDGACADRNLLPNWIRNTASRLTSQDEFHIIFTKIGRVNLDSFYSSLDNLDDVKYDIVSFFSLDQIFTSGLDTHLKTILA